MFFDPKWGNPSSREEWKGMGRVQFLSSLIPAALPTFTEPKQAKVQKCFSFYFREKEKESDTFPTHPLSSCLTQN